MLHSALSIPPHPMRTLNTARLRLLCQERHTTDRSDVAPLAVASHFTAEDPRRVEGPSSECGVHRRDLQRQLYVGTSRPVRARGSRSLTACRRGHVRPFATVLAPSRTEAPHQQRMPSYAATPDSLPSSGPVRHYHLAIFRSRTGPRSDSEG